MSAQSARGLFRATGKTSKQVALFDDEGEIVRADALPRDPLDFVPTPPEPTHALVHHEGACLREFRAVWEPAAGDGRMVRDLRASGLTVIASDLVDRGCGAEIRDFFAYETAPARAIVTNPPFNRVNWRDGRGLWISHAMETLAVDYMALLLPWAWPAAGGLAALWGKHPPARVYLIRWKIDFTGMGQPPMSNAWFVWERGHPGPPVLLMMDRVDPGQAELFGP